MTVLKIIPVISITGCLAWLVLSHAGKRSVWKGVGDISSTFPNAGVIVTLVVAIAILVCVVMWLDNTPGEVKLSSKGPGPWKGSYKRPMTRREAELAGMRDSWKPNGRTLGGEAPGHDVGPIRSSERLGVLVGLILGAFGCLALLGLMVLSGILKVQ